VSGGWAGLKSNRSTRKANSRSSQSRAIRHSAEPPLGAVNQSPKLDHLQEAAAQDQSRTILDPLVPALERVAVKIPSDIKYLDSVLAYMNERMLKLGVIDSEESDVLMALDEAIVNAIKHGNKGDARKAVHIVAELSECEICFTITDEGKGFVREDVPDPTQPSRLLEPSGRGLLLINHIMDEVCYNPCGNEIRMIKRTIPAEGATEETDQ
jgi:serine/threonine-protein kinase RsbW